MSAIPVLAVENTRDREGRPSPSKDFLQEGGFPRDLHVALIQKLQLHARGVSRKRRSELHRQFAWEWRRFMDCGGMPEHGGQIPQDRYPLLRTLVNQVMGRGEPILIS